jgi:UMF1 family MFS transporter
VLVFGLVTNVSAGIGAYFFGFLDDRLGGKRTIGITIVGLFLSTLIATVAPNEVVHILGVSFPGEAFLWLAGLCIGIFSGPNQAASRSLLGRFAPPEKENEFYGFFAFSGKATAFIGPFLFGSMTSWFHSARAGISIILLLFLVGGVLLYWVNEAEGIARAGRMEAQQITES